MHIDSNSMALLVGEMSNWNVKSLNYPSNALCTLVRTAGCGHSRCSGYCFSDCCVIT